MTRKTKNRLKTARKDALMLLMALMPALAALNVALQSILPELKAILSPEVYAAVAFTASAVGGLIRWRMMSGDDDAA